MKEYKHIFKRWIQRMYIDSARKMDYERGHRSKYELDCLSICKKLIDKPDTQLLMTPLSNKKYIHNPANSIFITIEGNTVNVINHKYSYTVVIQDKSKIELREDSLRHRMLCKYYRFQCDERNHWCTKSLMLCK